MSKYLTNKNILRVTEVLNNVKQGGVDSISKNRMRKIVAQSMEPMPTHDGTCTLMLKNLKNLGIISGSIGEKIEISLTDEMMEKLRNANQD